MCIAQQGRDIRWPRRCCPLVSHFQYMPDVTRQTNEQTQDRRLTAFRCSGSGHWNEIECRLYTNAHTARTHAKRWLWRLATLAEMTTNDRKSNLQLPRDRPYGIARPHRQDARYIAIRRIVHFSSPNDLNCVA